MTLCIGTINGYNNLIVIASPNEMNKIQLGQNNVNDEPIIPQETFQEPPDDFDDTSDFTLDESDNFDNDTVDTLDTSDIPVETPVVDNTALENQDFSHDEKKLLIIITGMTTVPFLLWYLN